MSSISSTASTAYTSPKQRILDSILRQVSLGSISSTDQTALDSAVDSIDTSLQGDRSSASSSSALAPSAMKGRVDDLIAQQVSSGALTSDQADTLKKVFSHGHSGKGGHGGVAGAGGPPPGLAPPDDGTSDDPSAIATIGFDGTTSSGTGGSTGDLLSSFMKQLQASQSQTSAYGSSGTSGGTRTANALLLNFQA